MSTKTIQFITDLGPGMELRSGNVIVYKVEEDVPSRIFAETITGKPTFSLSLQTSGPGVYYITLEVKEYSRDGNTSSTGTRDILLLAMFDESSTTVCIGAPSTIAAAYTFARMIRLAVGNDPVFIAAKPMSATIAYGMKNNFVYDDGTVSKMISTPPNAMQTNSYAMFNFLSNLAYYNITDTNVYTAFLSAASTSDHTCTYFLDALMNMVRHPFNNVKAIYDLIDKKAQFYKPSLPEMKLPERKSQIPNQWTLTIKANNSGSKNFLFSGLAYVVFDKQGKAWIANNFRMGTPDSGTHCVVLNPDASPCSFSPISGGGILGPGFGVAINNAKDKIAIGNYGWGTILHNPEEGSLSMFTMDGEAISSSSGYTQSLSRVQGLTYDQKGNLWMGSMGSQAPMVPVTPDSIYTYDGQMSAVVVYPADETHKAGVNPDKAIVYNNFSNNPNESHGTFDVVIDSEGHGIASNTGNENAGMRSSVYKFTLENGELKNKFSFESDHVSSRDGSVGYEEFRQVQVNANNEVFVGAVSSHRIIKLDKELRYVSELKSETLINGPWGVTIDKSGTMFVANFGRDKERAADDTLDMNTLFGVTVIQNEDITTAKMMTLPTGGDSVTLANGQELYGAIINAETNEKHYPLCYEPLMRLTSVEIDGAGNLWAMNNWKPSALVDVETNPGGDGVVIFIGVAEPS